MCLSGHNTNKLFIQQKKENKKLAIAAISKTKLTKLLEEVWQWDETRRST